jgi:hypothetical protein
MLLLQSTILLDISTRAIVLPVEFLSNMGVEHCFVAQVICDSLLFSVMV